MASVKGTGSPLTRCPSPATFGFGKATVSAGGAAVLTADVACIEMFFQAATSNVSAVYVNLNAYASSGRGLQVPFAIATAVGSFIVPMPCPSTTVPNFFGIDADSVLVVWR